MTDAAVTPQLQLALDCANPHAQAKFWAAALGYAVERDGEFVQKMIDEGVATDADVTTVDGELAWRDGAAISDVDGGRPRWYFQLVPESKIVKNRMHVDVQVGPDESAPRSPASKGSAPPPLRRPAGTPHLVTMADPEGKEFCVA